MADAFDLEHRVLAALAAGFALSAGCRAPETQRSGPGPQLLDPVSSVSTADSGSTSAVDSPPPRPLPEPPPSLATNAPAPPKTRCEPHNKRETRCFTTFTGPPKQVPNPKLSFDANGCVDVNEVRDICNGVHDVLSGPRLSGGKCCFEVCTGTVAPCGRALTTSDGGREERVAGLVPRNDWLASIDGSDPPPLSRTLSAELAAAWLRDAVMEHASVASFARFALELLSFGAPAELVAGAHQAARDEVVHAELCFALAHGYRAGPALGPAPLSLAGIAPRASLAEAAGAAAEESCAGETFAALLASRALASCTHPGPAEALARIAADEARHAELGFRFIAWAIVQGGEAVRQAVIAGLLRGRDKVLLATAHPPAASPALAAHGRVVARDLVEVARAAAAVIDSARRTLSLSLTAPERSARIAPS